MEGGWVSGNCDVWQADNSKKQHPAATKDRVIIDMRDFLSMYVKNERDDEMPGQRRYHYHNTGGDPIPPTKSEDFSPKPSLLVRVLL